MAYAKGTEVPSEKTEMEIKQQLRKHGATAIVTGQDGDRSIVMFEMRNRRVRFTVIADPIEKFAKMKTGQYSTRNRTKAEQREAYEQGLREKWRLLFLLIRGKLELLAGDVETFEQEFLPYIVLPNNSTIGEHLIPQLDEIYSSGNMPPLLPTGK